MKLVYLVIGAFAGTVLALDCNIGSVNVDDGNVNAISGTWHIQCDGKYSSLSTRHNLFQDGKDKGGALVKDSPGVFTGLDGRFQFGPGLVSSVKGVSVCITWHANDESGAVTAEKQQCFTGPNAQAANTNAINNQNAALIQQTQIEATQAANTAALNNAAILATPQQPALHLIPVVAKLRTRKVRRWDRRTSRAASQD